MKTAFLLFAWIFMLGISVVVPKEHTAEFFISSNVFLAAAILSDKGFK